MLQNTAPDGTKNLIGKRVRKLRMERDLSQNELSYKLQLLGYNGERGLIKRIELGTRYVSDIEIKILADFFNVSYEYLIDGDDT